MDLPVSRQLFLLAGVCLVAAAGFGLYYNKEPPTSDLGATMRPLAIAIWCLLAGVAVGVVGGVALAVEWRRNKRSRDPQPS